MAIATNWYRFLWSPFRGRTDVWLGRVDMPRRKYLVEDLIVAVERLPAKEAQAKEYKAGLLCWLKSNPQRRSAQDWYNSLHRVEWLLWLNEAAGETPARIRVASAAAYEKWWIAARARVVRRYCPWQVLEALLFNDASK